MDSNRRAEDQPAPDTEPTGGTYADLPARTEREVALRMITSRAVVDEEFYQQLRDNPRAAIDKLHIRLDDSDLARFEQLDWKRIDSHVQALREELGFNSALRGAW